MNTPALSVRLTCNGVQFMACTYIVSGEVLRMWSHYDEQERRQYLVSTMFLFFRLLDDFGVFAKQIPMHLSTFMNLWPNLE